VLLEQNSQSSTAAAGHPETRQPGQDSQDRTARTGQPGQDSQDRTDRKGEPEQDRQNETSRTGEAEDGMQKRKARTGLPGIDPSTVQQRLCG
jgi:hypothetical protein